MNETLLKRWRGLAGQSADALGEALVAAWTEAHRCYHDTSHLIWLLDEAERRAALISDPAFVGYAIWFHDAVYEAGKSDNESLSATWARTALAAQPALAERVARVIEMTKNHAEGEAEGDAALFLDMDVAVLGEDREIYCAYAAGVRAEFAMFTDAVFAVGRTRFLQLQLATPRLFRTDVYRIERGDAARANMAWELEELKAGRMVLG